jgi:outer membrane lipoprotein carrier protein
MKPLLLLAAVAVLPSSVRAEAPLSVDKVVARVQKLYDGTTDFTASFEQEYEMANLGRSQTSKGRVAFQRPGRIRFDYLEPLPKTFSVDGSTLWVFQPQDGQALVDRCFKADGLTASLVFLGGSGKISQQFDVTEAPADESHHGLKLTPKAAQNAYKSITLWVDRKTFEVSRTVVEDPSGNPNAFTFVDVKRNKGVKKDQVVFSPPSGVTVNPIPGSCVK